MSGLMHIKEDGNDSIKVLRWDRLHTFLCSKIHAKWV